MTVSTEKMIGQEMCEETFFWVNLKEFLDFSQLFNSCYGRRHAMGKKIDATLIVSLTPTPILIHINVERFFFFSHAKLTKLHTLQLT